MLAGQGWGAWPECSARLGLSGTSGSIAADPSAPASEPSAVEQESPDESSDDGTSDAGTSDDESSWSDDVAEEATAPREVEAVPLSGQTYTVVSGDTLSQIATRLGLSGGWQQLADANAAEIADPDLILPGQVLQLPA